MSDEHQQDRDEAWLGRVYHSGEPEEPPAALDRRILAAAASGRRRSRWRWPAAGVATAAMAVLALAVLMPRSVQTPVTLPPAPTSPPAAELSAPARTARTAANGGADADGSADAEAKAAASGGLAAPRDLVRPAAAEPEALTRMQRESSSAGYSTDACPTPFPLPAGATVRPLVTPGSKQGVRVQTADGSFTIRCVDGTWVRDPAAGDQGTHSNR